MERLHGKVWRYFHCCQLVLQFDNFRLKFQQIFLLLQIEGFAMLPIGLSALEKGKFCDTNRLVKLTFRANHLFEMAGPRRPFI